MADGGVGEMALLEAVTASEGAGAIGALEGAGLMESMGGLSALGGAGTGASTLAAGAIPGVSASTLGGLETYNPEIYQQLLGAFQNAPTSAQMAAQFGSGSQLAMAPGIGGDAVMGDVLSRGATNLYDLGATDASLGAAGEANAAASALQVAGNADKAALLSNEGYQGSLLPTPSAATAAEAPAWESPLKPWYDLYKSQDPLTQGVMKYGGMGLGALGAVKAMSKPTSVAAPGKYTGPLSKYSMASDYQPYTYKPYAEGGIASLGGYSDGGRLLKGPGDGMSDNIPANISGRQPARLADGEFVVPADVVSGLGNGSTDAGAKQLYKMLDKVRTARTGTKKQGKQINPNKVLPT